MFGGSPQQYEPRRTFGSNSQAMSKSQFTQDRGIIYKTDGSGRDTYIFSDNGGFSVPYNPT